MLAGVKRILAFVSAARLIEAQELGSVIEAAK